MKTFLLGMIAGLITLSSVARGAPLAADVGAYRRIPGASGFEWSDAAGNAASQSLVAAKGPLSCEFRNQSQKVGICKLVPIGTAFEKLVFASDDDPGRVTAVVVKNTVDLVSFPVADCKFSTTGRLRNLYAGALSERLQIDGPQFAACLARLASSRRVSLTNGSVVLDGEVVSGKGNTFIRIGPIPDDLTPGWVDWQLSAEQSIVLGTLRIMTKGAALVVKADANGAPRLSVDYGSAALNDWQSGLSVDGQAVVTTTDDGRTSYVTHTAEVTFADPELARVSHDLVKNTSTAGTSCPTHLEFRRDDCWNWETSRAPSPLSICDCADLEQRVSDCSRQIDLGAAPPSNVDRTIDDCRDRTRPWRLRANGWGDNVWFPEGPFWYQGSERLDSPTRIQFAVFGSHRDPLEVEVDLSDGADLLLTAKLKLANGARVESLPLPIANALQVRCGSRSAPIDHGTVRHRFDATTQPRGANRVKGDNGDDANRPDERGIVTKDFVRNGETRAVDDADVAVGKCVLFYSADRVLERLWGSYQAEPRAEGDDDEMAAAPPTFVEARNRLSARIADRTKRRAQLKQQIATMTDAGSRKSLEAQREAIDEEDDRTAGLIKAVRGLARLYGQQLLEVTVYQGGSTPTSVSWSLNPTQDAAVPLPVPIGGSGMYSVTVRLSGPQPPAVVYRDGPKQSATSRNSTLALGELEFRANLRPRGHLGWSSAPIRTFVTFPVRFTGIRMPAKSAELKSSDALTTVQVSPIRAGVMFALEPWDYDMDRSKWNIPIRFMTGFDLFTLSSGEFAPSFLAGISATFPIIAASGQSSASGNLGTDVAIGSFWELDLERRRPFEDGSHFLLTLGVDVFSLFAK